MEGNNCPLPFERLIMVYYIEYEFRLKRNDNYGYRNSPYQPLTRKAEEDINCPLIPIPSSPPLPFEGGRGGKKRKERDKKRRGKMARYYFKRLKRTLHASVRRSNSGAEYLIYWKP
ncbi:hypothetical protein CEXT_294651 [Caerostris extrusa]|uniref:Uncharacterized protein n=1 Tax=Caerostris extrusa TaxID=172846 RepID=A0AAV4RSG5_CAEEX|nr:hypothetical protein CEXT_294651 [Caerostris extrusa]